MCTLQNKVLLRQIFHLNFCYFGLQFALALEIANMSLIFIKLGASVTWIAMLFLPSMIIALLTQPFIGYISDRIWTPLGRRTPFILLSGLIGAATLLLIPYVHHLWLVVICDFLLNIAFNMGIVPTRALIADQLPENQQVEGYAIQSLMIGFGATVGAALPFVLNKLLSLHQNHQLLPAAEKMTFIIGAFFILGTAIWTTFFTHEIKAPFQQKVKTPLKELLTLPRSLKQLMVVLFFAWFGIACFNYYFPIAITQHIFHATDIHSGAYTQGMLWVGIYIAVYNVACLLFSAFIPLLNRYLISKHLFLLFTTLGGLAFIGLLWIQNPYWVFPVMIAFGLLVSGLHVFPFAAITKENKADDNGFILGFFNMFLILPSIVCSLFFGDLLKIFDKNAALYGVVIGGVAILLASLIIMHMDSK